MAIKVIAKQLIEAAIVSYLNHANEVDLKLTNFFEGLHEAIIA